MTRRFLNELPGGVRLLCAVMFAGGIWAGGAADLSADELLDRAQALAVKGQLSDALVLAGQAVASAPENPQCRYVRGRLYARNGDHARAVADFDEALKREPRAVEIHQHRGVAHFKLGNFRKSIEDFDAYLKVLPDQDPYHWQRGIAYYYAGEYEKGAKQFERHQTVNTNDVENAVWHFLCVARAEGLEKAREKLIPITGDPRVPMMKVHELFAGKAKPEEVLAAAESGKPLGGQRKERLFYAHLYLGLYFEALGDKERTREHIMKAVKEFPSEHYMGDVARVHAKILNKAGE